MLSPLQATQVVCCALTAKTHIYARNGTYTGSPDDCLLQDRAGKMEIPMYMMALKDHTDITALAAMAHFAPHRPVLAGNHPFTTTAAPTAQHNFGHLDQPFSHNKSTL